MRRNDAVRIMVISVAASGGCVGGPGKTQVEAQAFESSGVRVDGQAGDRRSAGTGDARSSLIDFGDVSPLALAAAGFGLLTMVAAAAIFYPVVWRPIRRALSPDPMATRLETLERRILELEGRK